MQYVVEFSFYRLLRDLRVVIPLSFFTILLLCSCAVALHDLPQYNPHPRATSAVRTLRVRLHCGLPHTIVVIVGI